MCSTQHAVEAPASPDRIVLAVLAAPLFVMVGLAVILNWGR